MPASVYSLQNYLWFAGSTGLMLLAPFTVALLLSRTDAMEQLGLYSYAYAVTAPLQAFAGIHARVFVAMKRLDGHTLEDVLAQRAYMALALAGALTAFSAWRDPGELPVLLAMGLVRVAESTGDVSMGALQAENAPRLMTIAYGVRSGASLGAFGLGFWLGYPLWVSLAAMASGMFLTFATFETYALRRIGQRLRPRAVVASLMSARPVTLTRLWLPGAVLNAITVLESNVPRYAVEHFLGLRELAVYTTFGFLLGVATNVVHPVYLMTLAPLGQLAGARVAESIERLWQLIRLNGGVAVSFGLLLVLGAWLFGEATIRLLFGDALAGYRHVLTIMAIGAAIGSNRSCLGFILTALNVLRSQSVLSVVNAAVFVTLVVGVARQHGLVGISLAWALASCATAALALGILLRFQPRAVLPRPAARQCVGL